MKVTIKTNRDSFYHNCHMIFQPYGIKTVRDESDVIIVDAEYGAVVIPENTALLISPADAEKLLECVTQLSQAKVCIKETEQPDCEVSEILQHIGVPVRSKGYRYLVEAVLLAIQEPEVISAVTKRLYPDLAKRHNATSAGLNVAFAMLWMKRGTSATRICSRRISGIIY